MGKKKIILVGLFSLLFLLCIACSSSSNAGGSEEITIMANLTSAQAPAEDNPILEKLEESTGTELNITWVMDEVYDEKMNAVIATGAVPQAMFVKNQDSFKKMKDSINEEQYWDIEPYLEDYEHLSNLNPDVLNNTRVNGKLYSLYSGRPASRWGLIYRKDWAENLGMEAPTNTDELYEMFRAFTEDDPDGNGQDDTIGVAAASDLVYGGFKFTSSYFGTPNNWGEKDGKLQPEFMFDGYMDTMNFFKDLRDKGYVNLDFPATSQSDQNDMLITGKAGALVSCICSAGSFQDQLQKNNPDAELDVQNRISGPDNGPGNWSNSGYGAVVLFPKASNETEEDLRKVLAFFNELMKPENYNLLTYGIEGTHYEVVDGKAKGIESAAELSQHEVRPVLGLVIGDETTVDAYQPYPKNELYAKQYEQILDNNNILINDPTAPLDSATYGEKGGTLQQIIDDATINYMLGDLDEAGFEQEIEKWKKEGGEQVIEEYNAEYKN
ncbi:putative aldouronate transport system substrate-binding protein [Gracilibacillus ureilyticus]|uniref:Putative aldouronate transport system substrate-binding protein n=1 Tax=Gracilibacillus ureilyticus TaxID=531814 RepID=A0A1H9VVI6_9BACI|nr:extracellular solute-binding protein [Gracilibacillus ureilyticus]SES25303.1 putative aldouronate transport system substrate-binding protein [Gracilibacillus ureilyticus]